MLPFEMDIQCFYITLFVAIVLPVATLFVFKIHHMKKSSHVKEDAEPQEPHIVIDPAKAFCQRMKFIVRMKKRMKEFKTKKDSMENQKK